MNRLGRLYNVLYITSLVIAVQRLFNAYTDITYNYILLIISVIIINTALEYVSGKDREIKCFTWGAFVLTLIVCVSVLYLQMYRQSTDEGADMDISRYVTLLTLISSISVSLVYRIIHHFTYTKGLVPFVLIIVVIISRIINVNITLETVILVLYVSIINAMSIRGGGYHIYLTPYVLVFCCILYVLPTRNEPLSWGSVSGIFEGIGDKINNVWYDIREYMGIEDSGTLPELAGYNETDAIGFANNIEGDDTVQLRIDATPRKANEYIIGSYYNEYDGKEWKKNYTDENYPEHDIELMECLNRIYMAVNADKRNAAGVKIDNMRITYRGNRKKTVFAPYNMICTDSEWNYTYNNGSMLYEDYRKSDDYYNAWFVYIDSGLENRILSEYAQKAYMKSYGFNEVTGEADIKSSDIPDMGTLINYMDYSLGFNLIRIYDRDTLYKLRDYMNNRQQYIYVNYYDHVKINVPARVDKLAHDITKNANTINEKLFSIENYLVNNYTYSMNVDNNTSGECNVDTFLFDTRKGSCLHYATAFAALARCIGIPSRLVTGYCAGYDNVDTDRVYTLVTGSRGHAWPEVYINGAGWFKFEPTTEYNAVDMTGDKKEPEDNQATIKTESSMTDGNRHINGQWSSSAKGENQASPLPTGKGQQDEEGISGENGHRNGDENAQLTDENSGKNGTDNVMNYARVIIIAISFTGLLIVLISLIGFVKIRRISSGNKAGNNCSRNISRIIELYERRCARQPEYKHIRNNTLNETADIMTEWLGEEEDNYRQLIEAYQECIFGDRKIRAGIVKDSEALLNRLKKKQNRR